MKEMKKIFIVLLILMSFNWACESDKEFLDRPPTQVLTNEQAFSDPAQVLSIVANLYSRQFNLYRLSDWRTFGDFNEGFYAQTQGIASQYHTNSTWDYRGMGLDPANNVYSWTTWDYTYIRELNLFLERVEQSTITQDLIDRYTAEVRFLRASYYLELAQLYGGVPIILEAQEYDFSGDPTYLQVPRSTEAEIYDFIIQEAEELKSLLPADPDSKSRATKGAALAMKARAAIFAASLAKYNNAVTPSVSLQGGAVGIPASRADEYYNTALVAAKEIIDGNAGSYSLYLKNPTDLSENFAAVFYDKGSNPEVIWADDYLIKYRVHYFTGANQPRYGAEEEEGGALNPSLNLVQEFELLDNTFAPLATTDANGDPIYYENQSDIFAGRDARLGGTVILPGSTFKSRPVDIWAGYQLADGSIITGTDRGDQRILPGQTVEQQVVGFDGPVAGAVQNAQMGFYLRKYVDPVPGSGQRGVQSEVWKIKYRYAEILLIAAEAAFELGDPGTAAGYMNQVRQRAGFTTDLTAADITFDRIVHERRVEFAFEGLYFMDLKRFRIAHEIFDGVTMSKADLLADIGKATNRSTMPWGLWPYRIYDPGSPNDGKWIYKEFLSSQVTAADNWQLGNYYSIISDDILSRNPKLVKQPLQ